MKHFSVLDLEELFARTPEAIVLDARASINMSADDTTAYIAQLFQENTKEFDFVAACKCGHLTGNYFKGGICPECKSIVTTGMINELNYKAWIEIPDIIPPVPHPVLYRVLKTWLGRASKNNWHVDSLLSMDVNLRPKNDDGVLGQGFQYFYENFDNVINYLFNIKSKPKRYYECGQKVLEFIEMHRPKLFIRHFPILNKSLHVVNHHGGNKKVDSSLGYILKAFADLTVIIYSHSKLTTTSKTANEHLYNVYMSLLDYSKEIIDGKLLKKHGLIRSNILGSRLHFTARAVVAPNTHDHWSDEVYMPWKMMASVLKLEIINLLMQRHNHSMNEALERHHLALTQYDSLINDIIDTLILECPYKGLPVLVGRNPK